MIQLDVLGAIELRRDGEPVRAVLVQPRRFALLAYLAVARPHGYHSRDRLAGLFWPDVDEERARNSLRQALHQLRKALGEDAILARGEREIGVNPELFRIDAAQFDDAIAAGRDEEALDLYRGEFLPGFFLDDALEVERFIESERERYRREAVGAAWRVVAADEARGDVRAAASHARRALVLEPFDEAGLRRTVGLVSAAGDRGGALRLYDEFVRRMSQDLELSPSQETTRFIERLRGGDAPPPPAPVAAAPREAEKPTAPESSRRSAPWTWVAAVTGIAVVVAILVRAVARPATPPLDVSEPGAVSALGVLPFANLTGDPGNEYLADGITDELMTALARIPGLQVAGHTSVFTFKGKDVPLDSIGRALRVGHVIEGSVRVTGERVRIVAALVDTRSGYHVWSDAYDGALDDVLSMQNSIARAIVDALRPRLGNTAASAVRMETARPDAHTQRLLGLQAMRPGGREDYAAAGRYFQRAIELDSTYAEAYAGLAAIQLTEVITGAVAREAGFLRARRTAERALALDSTVGDAYGILGRIVEDYWWDFDAADRHFRRAIELSPGNGLAYRQRARLMALLGRREEAITLARRATELDPLAPNSYSYLGLMLYYEGRHTEALESFDRAMALVPDQPFTVAYRSYPLSAVGRHAEAIAQVEEALARAPYDLVLVSAAATAQASGGNGAAARTHLARLEAMPGSSPYLAAEILAALGESERMFERLERAVAEKDPLVVELGAMPVFQPWRTDPRMREIRARIRLPE
jgi:DNA-binding SARP family transcriptional activator/TolB-like protein/Tfp pilus assembly protein PilF